MLQVGTYRTERGELLHYRIDASGKACCEVECSDGSVREGCEICDAGVLLSDDPAWPWRDPGPIASLAIID
jgi:hypothetical protein